MSPLLVSITGSQVAPCTPTVGRQRIAAPPALHLAAHCGDLAAVRALLAAFPNAAELSMNSGPRNWLPVGYAAHMGHLAVVRELMEAGSPMPHELLLLRAVGGGQTQMLSWLLGNAELQINVNEHHKALKKAVKSDFPRTLTTLLSLARLSAESLGMALEWAVSTGSAVRLSHLLEAGADPAHSKGGPHYPPLLLSLLLTSPTLVSNSIY